MGQQRYSPEFKDEAVRQVVERGYSVKEVAERLGVSSHSLYKWTRSVRPTNEEQREEELLEAKREILKLRSELRRTQEERDILKKGRRVLCQGARVKYAFMNSHRREFRLRTMCRVLQVAPSGFYAWLHKPKSDRTIEDERLLVLIKASHLASGRIYGAPRIFLDLREAGEKIGRNRVARIMRQHRIRAIRGYKIPRIAGGPPAFAVPNHLQRQFTSDKPDRAWVTDITYIRTWEGWIYLAAVMDLYSRMIVGWSMCVFRTKPDTDSGGIRTPIPIQSGQ